MFALLRLLVIGFVALSIVYICLSLYSRAVRRSKLKAEWDEDRDGDFDAFIDAGMAEYDGSLRKKLILGVYVVPLIVISVIIYLTNFA